MSAFDNQESAWPSLDLAPPGPTLPPVNENVPVVLLPPGYTMLEGGRVRDPEGNIRFRPDTVGSSSGTPSDLVDVVTRFQRANGRERWASYGERPVDSGIDVPFLPAGPSLAPAASPTPARANTGKRTREREPSNEESSEDEISGLDLLKGFMANRKNKPKAHVWTRRWLKAAAISVGTNFLVFDTVLAAGLIASPVTDVNHGIVVGFDFEGNNPFDFSNPKTALGGTVDLLKGIKD